MKKLTLLTALSMCFAGGVFAQARPVPPNATPTACMAEFKKVSGESDKMFADGVAKKTIDAKEAATYKARDTALQKQFDSAVADKKLSQPECNALLKSASDQKAEVTKMIAVGVAAANSSPTACIAEFKKVSTESDKIFADGMAKKTINPQEAAAYKNRDVALQKQFDTAMADKKLSLTECNALLKSANDEKVAVTKMASAAGVAANSSPTACIAEFRKVSAESDKIYADGIAKKTINPQEAAAYKNRDVALQRQFNAAMADRQLTSPECNSLLKSANEEKVVVTKMAAAANPAAAPAAPVAALLPQVQACLAQFKAISTESDRILGAATTAGRITPQEAQAYKARDTALDNQYAAAMKDGNMTIQECSGLMQAGQAQRAAVLQMAAR